MILPINVFENAAAPKKRKMIPKLAKSKFGFPIMMDWRMVPLRTGINRTMVQFLSRMGK